MRQGRNEQSTISINFSYIFRCLKKNIMIILMCACIVGIVAYVFLDNYQKDTYIAGANLAVIARDNSNGKLSSYNYDAAVTRCLNVLNSDTLKEQVYKADPDEKNNGTFEAAVVEGSNIITMRATSESAENAFRLLKAAIEEYPSLAGYFESGYLVKTLDTFSTENIVSEHPRNGFYAALAAALVIFAGIGLTGCISVFTDKVYSKEQADTVLDMDILGVQHYIKKKKNQKTILVTDKATDISYIEEIDKLVTNIKEKMDAHKYQTLMISSIKENEGKSTIASNIALSFARRGKKVLLIDADLRRPAIYKVFELNIDENHEFSQYLEGNLNVEQILTRKPEWKKIRFVLQEKAVGDPDKLLDADRFSQLMNQMKKYFDYIILDTPPVGIVRDAEVVASSVEGAVLVLKQDQEKASEINDIIDIMEDAGTVVLGGVLTMARGGEMVNSQKKSYGKYYHSYGYDRV